MSRCLRRVRNLKATGVIAGYAALLDRAAVRCDHETLVWVTLSEVTRTTMLAFEELYMDVLAALPHVQKITSQLAVKVVKQTHELPVDNTV